MVTPNRAVDATAKKSDIDLLLHENARWEKAWIDLMLL